MKIYCNRSMTSQQNINHWLVCLSVSFSLLSYLLCLCVCLSICLSFVCLLSVFSIYRDEDLTAPSTIGELSRNDSEDDEPLPPARQRIPRLLARPSLSGWNVLSPQAARVSGESHDASLPSRSRQKRGRQGEEKARAAKRLRQMSPPAASTPINPMPKAKKKKAPSTSRVTRSSKSTRSGQKF